MREVLGRGVVAALTAGLAGTAWGQCGIFELRASDGGPQEYFGATVGLSADGATAVVGAAYHDEAAGEGADAAWVFERAGRAWLEQIELIPADSATYQSFGYAVAISADGSTIAVSAILDSSAVDNGGSVYIFVRQQGKWTEEAELLPADPQTSHQFGFSVDLSDDGGTALVGARFDDEACGGPKLCASGAAYVFVRRSGAWSQQAKLLNAGWTGGEHGYSVALSGDGGTALVGGPYVEPGGGAVAVFVREGTAWHDADTLTAPVVDGDEDTYFGWSVAISSDGQVAAAGAPYHGAEDEGAVYVFLRQGEKWALVDELVAADAIQTRQFGLAVAVSPDGGMVLIGAPSVFGVAGADAAYVFERQSGSDWEQQARLFGLGPHAAIGAAVAISGDAQTALLGAPWRFEDGQYFLGAAFVFDRGCNDVDGDGAFSITDLLELLSTWGTCPEPPATCPADLDGDGTVGMVDLLLLLAEWT